MLKVFHLFIVFIICDHVVFQYRHKPSTLEQSSCFLKARKKESESQATQRLLHGSDLLRHQLHLPNKVISDSMCAAQKKMKATRRHEQRVSGIKPLKNLYVYIDPHTEGRPDCDTAG
ncbi:hypothetical protein Nmel_000932 [Mimus melanotis]